MGKTTNRNTLTIAERLRRIFQPCPKNNGNESVTIKVFDKHSLISEMINSQDMVTELQTFLNGMGSTPGLPNDVVTRLSSIHFTVTYKARGPGREEIESFAVTDFPIHLLTASGLFVSSAQEIIELMVLHRIPEKTTVRDRLGPDTVGSFPVFPYKTIEEDWGEPKIQGFGVPGRYDDPLNNQNQCRKIGIIKMQGFMTENVPAARLPEKILFVIKHELGHMFGLRHHDNSIMNPEYNLDQDASHYTNDELFIISSSLDSLIQS
jgi:hypothetical protein